MKVREVKDNKIKINIWKNLLTITKDWYIKNGYMEDLLEKAIKEDKPVIGFNPATRAVSKFKEGTCTCGYVTIDVTTLAKLWSDVKGE